MPIAAMLACFCDSLHATPSHKICVTVFDPTGHAPFTAHRGKVQNVHRPKKTKQIPPSVHIPHYPRPQLTRNAKLTCVKMAASLLRIGGLRCVKCFQAESWSTLCRAPSAAAYSTKYGGSKKSSKKNSDKKQVKTYFDIEKLVQHKPFEFPKKDVSAPAVSSTAHPSLYTLTPEKAANRVAEAVPASAAGTAPVHGPVIEPVPAVVPEVQPVIEAAAEDKTAMETFAAPLSEVGPKPTVKVVQDSPKAVPSEANVGAAVDPLPEATPLQTVAETTNVESAAEPVPTVAQMEASTEPKTEASPVEAARTEIVAEVTPAEAGAEPAVAAIPVGEPVADVADVAKAAPTDAPADLVIEAVTVEAAAPPVVADAVVEAAAEPVVEDAPVKDVAESVAEVAAEPRAEASPVEAAADPVIEAVIIDAAVKPVAEADVDPVVGDTPVNVSEPVTGIVEELMDKAAEPIIEETLVNDVAELALQIVADSPLEAAAELVVEAITVEAAVEEGASPVAESVAAEAAADVSTPEHDTVELLELAPVIHEDVGEKLQEEKPAQMDPIQRLFLDSIRQYSTGNQITTESVDGDSEYQRALEQEIAKLQRLYGGGDLTSFPELKFPEPTFDEVFHK
uniref:cytadherence high molecular weight protein 1 n=1 Tax=Doryrhamphus excisus TaxID=161450 RepID=UPI0025ADAE83|nr:cytadherence high molecular weight protein 1 [Doryrhamphus excisus]